jgi:DNA-binding CsgD family transcriptional regulator
MAIHDNFDYAALESLSPRERQVLQLTATGMTSREVATQLGISAKTVESFVSSTNKKLGTRSRLQQVILFYRAQLAGQSQPGALALQ